MHYNPNDDRKVVAVYKAPDPGLARVLAAHLLDHGITCRVSERIVLEGGLSVINPHPDLAHEILVFEDDRKRAGELIEEFMENPAEGD
jgi:hypothetical protein